MKSIFGVLLALSVFGCGNVAGVQKVKSTTAVANSFSANSCQGNELSAKITGVSGNDTSFRQVVGDLVSVSMNPEELGTISASGSGSTGVTMNMALKFDSSHQVISSSSTFKISIRDSFVGQMGTDGTAITSIDIVHSSHSQLSGYYDPTQKILRLQYSDSYGTITVQGQTSGNTLSGQVQFANSVAWDGSSPRQGTLGAFQASSCSFQ